MEDKLIWRKSSASGGDASGGDCVELATRGDAHLVRDTKDRTGPVLAFGGSAWSRFIAEVKSGAHTI